MLSSYSVANQYKLARNAVFPFREETYECEKNSGEISQRKDMLFAKFLYEYLEEDCTAFETRFAVINAFLAIINYEILFNVFYNFTFSSLLYVTSKCNFLKKDINVTSL